MRRMLSGRSMDGSAQCTPNIVARQVLSHTVQCPDFSQYLKPISLILEDPMTLSPLHTTVLDSALAPR